MDEGTPNKAEQGRSNKLQTLLKRLAVNKTVVAITAAVAVLAVTGAVFVLLMLSDGGQDEPSPVVNNSTDVVEQLPVIDPVKYNGTLLIETDDMGAEYQNETLFIGDSNTYRFMMYEQTTLENCIGIVGMGTTQVLTEKCVTFEGQKAVTIPEAVAIMQPRRIVLTFGTNDFLSKTETFIKNYTTMLDGIMEAYPYADIIINAVPPVARVREYPGVKMETINAFNVALADLAAEKGCYFLNSSEALLDEETGYMLPNYTLDDGIHINKNAAEAFFRYFRTHALDTEDRRPALKPVPKRDEPEPYIIESDIVYYSSKITLEYTVNDPAMGSVSGSVSQSVSAGGTAETVTATPAEGYRFVEWRCSAGVIGDVKNPSLTFQVPAGQKDSIVITAVFESAGNMVSIASGTSGCGASLRIGSEGTGEASVLVPFESPVTVIVTPSAYFKLDGVYAGSTLVLSAGAFSASGSSLVAQYTPTSAVQLTAKFSLNYDPMAYVTVNPAGSATVSASVSADGATITYTCTVLDTTKTSFKHWVVNGALGTTSTTLITAKTDNLAVTAEIHTHTWDGGTVVTAATCGAAGSTKYKCTDCSAEYTQTVPATEEHTWNTTPTTEKPATCGVDGEKVFTCSVCGATKKEAVPATEAHTWNTTPTTEKPATCGVDGEKVFTCSVCGGTKTEVVPATGNHSYGAAVVTDPTCGKDGASVETCTVCGKEETTVLPATGNHNYGEPTVVKEATCGAAGEKLFTCSVCGGTKTEAIPATGNHSYADGTCTVCGAPDPLAVPAP